MRPTPDRVREALFSILGNAVPDRPFIDLFAGTGSVGVEGLSRGASNVILVEREPRLAGELLRHVQAFGIGAQVQIHRADVYRWVERWKGPSEPVTVFLGPPFPDFEQRLDDLLQAVVVLREKVEAGSVLVLQSEKAFDTAKLPAPDSWDHRLYGRNRLSIWVKDD
jgi:16S rRNA (guanine(966)-N(2))-methyltransferase RsmD